MAKTKTPVKIEVNKKSSGFDFGQISKRKEDKAKLAEKEERRSLIEDLIGTPKKTDTEKVKYTIEETDYEPSKWIVVITPKGLIYREPVPRCMEYKNFIGLLASAPDKMIISSTMIDFDAMIYHTAFDVKGVDCEIVTAEYTGNRLENPYGGCFDIKNGTEKIGGNIIFAGPEKGFTANQAKTVIAQIIKILNKNEETIEWK